MAADEADLQQLSAWCDRIDQAAVEKARNWYRDPLFVPFDGYGGLSLGELAEYAMLPVVLKALMETNPRD